MVKNKIKKRKQIDLSEETIVILAEEAEKLNYKLKPYLEFILNSKAKYLKENKAK